MPPHEEVEGSASRVSRVDYDAELQRHHVAFRGAWDIGRRDHVLDIGCGRGLTTRDAARLAAEGSALGVDISAEMIERARQLAAAEGLDNATFVHADAEAHHFAEEKFDAAISRFGTMFFADPPAAFANIARAVRPGGRVVMMVWQARERNEWFTAIRQSLAGREAVLAAFPGVPDPFSLADPRTVRRLFATAGLSEPTFTEVHEPMYFGPDVAAALDWTSGFSDSQYLLERLEPASREHALECLGKMLAAHDTGEGVWFDSYAWIVTAARPPDSVLG
jgi:SAM-dependent methyltransferase